MKLTVSAVKKETKDAVSISFKNRRFFQKVRYKAGQFLVINVSIDGKTYKRAYSFSSSPATDEDLMITVKRVQFGKVSNYLFDSIKIGDQIEVEPPVGSFYVEPNKNNNKQYVLFAGGSGITPMMSIIKTVLAKEPNSKILLVYANQDVSAIIFHDQLKEIQKINTQKLSLAHILVENDIKEQNYYTGLASPAVLDKIFGANELEYGDHEYMICGPFGYMDKIKEILFERGIQRSQIKVEVFSSPKVQIDNKDLTSQVRIIAKGNIHDIEIKGNQTILQGAMKNSISMPYSCRSGMCSTCKATCVEGEVKMTEGHFLTQTEVGQGKILTCISFPISENVIIQV